MTDKEQIIRLAANKYPYPNPFHVMGSDLVRKKVKELRNLFIKSHERNNIKLSR